MACAFLTNPTPLCVTHTRQLSEEQKGDFATFGGYLCSLAGEIPATSDHIVVPDYIFTIVQVRY